MDAVPLAADSPFEDEFALAKIGIPSPYASLAFPRQGPPSPSYLDLPVSPTSARRWEAGFLWLMRRLQLANPGRRLIIKSPPHTARIRTLLKLFPDARFVHISRNPTRSILDAKALESPQFAPRTAASRQRRGWLPEYVLSTLPGMYAAYERDKGLIPPGGTSRSATRI